MVNEWITRQEWDNFMVGFAVGCASILIIIGIYMALVT